MIGGIVAGFGLDGFIRDGVLSGDPQLHIIGTPNNIGVGKVSNVTFITFSDGEAIGNVSLTIEGAATGQGLTDQNGMAVLPVKANSNGSINVSAGKTGYRNATSMLTATPGLVVSASPSSITSGTALFVTFSVSSVGKPVGGAALNLSGAGINIDGVTNSNGEIILQLNVPETGTISATARKTGFADGSTAITSSSQQTLGVSSSHSQVTVNVPAFVTFTVTAGGSALSDTAVSLSGAASGSGITNRDGRAIILINPGSTGTITASATRSGYAGGSVAITSTGTQSLSIASNPSTVTALVPTYITFTVTSGSNVIGEANVTLSGAASGNGVTNQNGQVILLVNSTSAGTITTSASKTGYSSGSTSVTAAGQSTLSVSANPPTIANGAPSYVTLMVTSGGSAVSGASVSVSGGGISADGVTNSAGQVTLLLNAVNTGTISVTARKTGYIDGVTTIAH